MAPSTPIPPPTLRVLVVDDFRDQAESTAQILGCFGYEADFALDGPSAFEKAASFASDVVLLDLGLPGVSGYEVGERLAGLNAARPPVVVTVTGWAREEDRRKALALGFHLHLAKPVDPQVLLGMLARIRDLVLAA